ncbi:MAG TPA: 5'-3' exonuclease H3TH domain-containing protein, partial [Acidimicrobiales bacterium]|nr:5'-3' exonuclease H3TH domain-containing protein [Acidimicrobiales bacterium]
MSSLAEAATDQRPLVLLDGMSLAFRAFFALPTDIATSEGLVTNALHGFAAMLLSLVRTQNPRALAVAFDLAGGTFRDAMVEDYKGGRAETPPEIEHQFALIRDLCEVLHIPVLGVPNFEADDVLATLATWGRNESIPVVVVTGDRDAFQLVEDPYVKVLYNRRGVSDYSLYDEAGIFARTGIEARRYPLLAALRGDTSDNLPGVPGVGEKTAAKLFAQYRDMDDLYAHLGDLTPKLRENLATYEERARNNEKVMLLIRDVPLDFTLHDITLGGWNRAETDAFFDRFEMTQMRSRFGQLMKEGLLGDAGVTSAPLSEPVEAKKTKTAKALKVAKSLDEVLASTTTPVVAYRHARAAVLDAQKGLVALCDLDDAIEAFARVAPCGHDLKALYHAAASGDRVMLEPADDTAIMAFLLDANSGRYDLAEVAQR